MSITVLNRCTYFLEKKKRKCRLLAKEGAKFCGEHSLFNETDTNNRILCPNDPKHSVFVDALENHLKNRCNSRIIPVKYISHNLNCTPRLQQPILNFTGLLFQHFLETAEIIEREYNRISKELTVSIHKTEQVDEYLHKFGSTLSDSSKKQLIQVSSIIGHISQGNLLTKNKSNCVVELGSGKAQLSYWLMKNFLNCSFLLVDRMGSRNKFDNRALQENDNLKVKRLRCSIEHLDLSKVDFVQEDDRVLTAICKHLCGNATDFGIRCILNAHKAGVKFNGFAFAPCCHHRTIMHEYVGLDYLHSIGIDTVIRFSALRRICSWSTCGFYNLRFKNKSNDNDNATDKNFYHQYEEELIAKHQLRHELNQWSIDYKILLGQKAKLLLEYGRVDFLRKSKNINVKLFVYVAPEISPENILILGTFN